MKRQYILGWMTPDNRQPIFQILTLKNSRAAVIPIISNTYGGTVKIS